jgi:hypothetical protein
MQKYESGVRVTDLANMYTRKIIGVCGINYAHYTTLFYYEKLG